MADTPRWTEYLPLSRLVPADRNPKAHDLEALRASMQRFGYVEPVVLDERTGKLVAGHGRLEELLAAKAAGLDPPDGVLVLDGEWTVQVVRGWSSKDDAEAEAYLVASNRITEKGGWQNADLYALLDDLTTSVAGLEGTGYTADDLDDLLALVGAAELPTAGTDATYADMPQRAAAAPPREVQGLREVGLMFKSADHREYQEHLAKLKRRWGEDAAPVVVLRAMREAAERE